MTKAFDRYGSITSPKSSYTYYGTPEYSDNPKIKTSTYSFYSVQIDSEASTFAHKRYWDKEFGLHMYDRINIRVNPNASNTSAKKNATNLRFSSFEEFEKFVFILNDRLADYYRAQQEYQED